MRLIGKLALVTDARSAHYGAWGTVRAYDGGNTYLLYVDGKYEELNREQFTIPGREL